MRVKPKILLFFLLISLITPPTFLRADEQDFNFSRQDHELHMLATYGLSLSATMLMRSAKVPRWKAVLLSSLTTMALAYGKETLIDPQYQRGDMVANSIGVATQALVVFSFDL